MSDTFAPDPLDETIVSLPAEIQRERLHIISLMTRLPGNSFGPLALLNVYAGGTDTVTRVPVVRFDIDLYYMADEHGALGMGLSYTFHGAFCTENEVYHFDNVFFKVGSCIFYCLVSTELAWRAQRVIASFSSSELSSHQIPRSLGSEGPLQLKGCTRTSCLFSPTTPSGASVLSALLFALSTPLRLRGRTGVFRRREGPPRLPISGLPFFRLFPFGLSPLRGVSSCRGAPPADPRFLWIRSPFFWSYVFFPAFVYAREVPVRGRTDVLSRPRMPVSSRIALHISSLLLVRSAEPFSTRAARRVFLAATADDFKSTPA